MTLHKAATAIKVAIMTLCAGLIAVLLRYRPSEVQRSRPEVYEARLGARRLRADEEERAIVASMRGALQSLGDDAAAHTPVSQSSRAQLDALVGRK